jgi:cell division protein FtsQ
MVACASLAALALGAWRFANQNDLFAIRAIHIEGLEHGAEQELVDLAPVKVGHNLFAADLDGMERALRRAPWVKTVQVRRVLPASLAVHVTEREAAALVDLGGLYLVDRDAQVFKRATPGDGLDLPVITGFSREDYAKRRADLDPLLAGALALLDSYARSPMAKRAPISELHVDPDQGVTLYVGAEGTQVRLGIGDLPAKLDRMEKIYSALGAEGKKPEVLLLDNRTHPNWVTVRLSGSGGAAQGRGGSGPRGH